MHGIDILDVSHVLMIWYMCTCVRGSRRSSAYTVSRTSFEDEVCLHSLHLPYAKTRVHTPGMCRCASTTLCQLRMQANKAGRDIADGAKNAGDSIKQAFSGRSDDAGYDAKKTGRDIGNQARDVADDAETKSKNVADKVAGAVKDAAGNVRDGVK